ncbi:MAG TPA: hypothetical protein GXZ32_04625 [Clostridiales bacterium]|nr:hypothetical protein [Clostridiales bacterium]
MKVEKSRVLKPFVPFILFLINIAYIELFKNHFYNIYFDRQDIINVLWMFMPLPSVVLGYVLVRGNNKTRIITLNVKNLIYILPPILCMYARIIYYQFDFIPLPLWMVNNFIEFSILGGVWLGVTVALMVRTEADVYRKNKMMVVNRRR